MTTPGRGVPLYLQLAGWLRGKIAAGELQPGDMAPGEMQLRDDYNVSRYTAAKALDQLASEGLLTRRPGIGSVITGDLPQNMVKVGPGTVIQARLPLPGAAEGWLPLLVISKPGEDPRVYDALTTAALCVTAADERGPPA